jgi:hypothetical protein
LKFLSQLAWENLPYTYLWHSMYQISYSCVPHTIIEHYSSNRKDRKYNQLYLNKTIALRITSAIMPTYRS